MLAKKVKKRASLLAIFLIASVLGVFLILNTLNKNILYFNSPTDIKISQDLNYNKKIRIGGMVKKNTLENVDDDFVSQNNVEDMESNVEMPPQRDIRETQPTISVNYRVVKNMKENNLKKDQNYSNPDNKDDWDNTDNDW